MKAYCNPAASATLSECRPDAADAAATGAALGAFALGLPAYVLIKALAPGFFAREDTATPVKIAALALVVNVALALALMPTLAHVGIALATAVSAWINAALLGVLLYRRGLLEPDRRLMMRLVRILFAALLMAGALWLIADVLASPLRQSDPAGVAALVLLVVVGMAVYAVLAQLLRATSLREMRSMFRRG